MEALARKFWRTFRLITAAPQDLPVAANDNATNRQLAEYIERSRVEAGWDYQPAASKMWWLP